MPKWTPEQQAAIDARGCNLLVAAAAGSGKTAVLVERILQLILKDKASIDRLLVVTFTKAAAAEMRERIGSTLARAIDEDMGDSRHLRQQLNLLSKASISTIHSFCTSVIRKYFHVINLDPVFRIGDETECILLRQELIEDLFEREYEKASETFLGLVERFGGSKQDTGLQNLVLDFHEFLQSKPFPEKWLMERVQDFARSQDELENVPWYQALLDTFQMEIEGIIHLLHDALDLCGMPGGPVLYRETLLDDLRQMEDMMELAQKNDLAAFMEAYKGVRFSDLSRRKQDADEDLKSKVKDLRKKAKDIWGGLGGSLTKLGLEECIEQLNELYPYMQYLCRLVIQFDDEYRQLKQERGILDFNDLEHYTLEILQHEEVARELQQKYDYIFIDEYQDSNLVQETIINYIRRQDNVFMVGDVKQSIYRFRLADPGIFLEKYNTYIPEEEAVNRRIDLNKNFRSRASILNAVNYIFENIMSSSFGELDYDAEAALYPGLDMPPAENPEVELHLVEKKADIKEDLDEEIENLTDIEVEASIAAERIQQLAGTEIYDSKTGRYRKAEYRDMVVLLRTTRGWATVFQDVFARKGIPVYADVDTGYFEALEVKTIVALLQLIDNKYQDIPLLTVMRSPIGGFDADDMIKIRTGSEARAFYQAAENYAQSHDDDLAHRLRDFYHKISGWQKASRYLPMEDFLWKLYTETGYYNYAGAMPGGAQRQANLKILLERARQFQQTSIKGLFQFIRFIDKLKSSSGDMGEAKALGENENVIRIMSIHKSKGLEFPIVIAAGLGKAFNLSDTKDPVLFHKDLGLGPRYVNPDTRQRYDTIARTVIKHVMRLESLAEEMRILYVSLTRPKEKLILLGSVDKLEESVEGWARPVSPYSLSQGKNFLDWIMPVLMRHPDCEELRALLGKPFTQPLWQSDSQWKIYMHDRSKIAAFNEEEAVKKQEFLHRLENPREYIQSMLQKKGDKDAYSYEERLRRMVEKRFVWEYPYRHAVNVPSKLTVTEITKLQGLRVLQISGEDQAPDFRLIGGLPSFSARPKFLDGSKGFSAAEKGTIIHFILQHLDLDRTGSREEIRQQVDEMVKRDLLTREEAEAADLNIIHAFFESETGRRMRKAECVRREVPFNYRKKAHEIMDNMQPGHDTLLIQGVIDCFFEEEGQWVIVDYKTDYVDSPERVNELVKLYQKQMNLYSEALEQITGKPVRERILYFLSINQAIKIQHKGDQNGKRY